MKALRYLLMIDILKRREMFADVLIKMKNLTKYMLLYYINNDMDLKWLIHINANNIVTLNFNADKYNEILKVLKEDFKTRYAKDYNPTSKLWLWSYATIIKHLKPDMKEFHESCDLLLGFNEARNSVAHLLKPLEDDKHEPIVLDSVIQALSVIYSTVFDTKEPEFDLFDRINSYLINEIG